MSRARMFARAARRGMSLVEIMVVIAIIGILTTVIAVNVTSIFGDSNADNTRLAIKNIRTILDSYSLKHNGKYPSTSEGLQAVKKYFPDDAVPKDAWGNNFQYFSPGTMGNHAYEIISLGSDGQQGGTGCAADINSWELDKKGCDE